MLELALEIKQLIVIGVHTGLIVEPSSHAEQADYQAWGRKRFQALGVSLRWQDWLLCLLVRLVVLPGARSTLRS